MTKSYLLYNNVYQDSLLALAEDIDEVIEVSKYYTKGVWFEYDQEASENDSVCLFEEREFGYDQFPDVAEERPHIKTEADERISMSIIK